MPIKSNKSPHHLFTLEATVYLDGMSLSGSHVQLHRQIYSHGQRSVYFF